jgi:hypothetical protein
MNKITIENFFKNMQKDWKKEYLINANDKIILDNLIKTTDTYFNLTFQKYKDDLIITIKLYAWSNRAQDYVPLKKSTLSEETNIPLIEQHYRPIIQNFLKGLKGYLNNQSCLKEFIDIIENPAVKYHYKLLNTFTKEELDKINSLYRHIPELDVCMFYQEYRIKFPYVFKVEYRNFFYIDSIEISVDLDDNDYARISDFSKDYKYSKISKEEALKKLLLEEEKRN